MSNILNFEKKSSPVTEKRQRIIAAREWLKQEEKAEIEYLAKPTLAIAGTFNPDLLAGSMARLLLNLGDEINMLGYELTSDSHWFDFDSLCQRGNSHELEQKLYRWDRRLVDLQDRFDLLSNEPVDCYLDAQYPEGMESKQLRAWLEQCTAQLNVYFIEMIPFKTGAGAQRL